MDNKSHPDKRPLRSHSEPGALWRFFQKLRETLGCQIPLGYEDEAGFHYGDHPGYVLQTVTTETGTRSSNPPHSDETISAANQKSPQSVRRIAS